jgi:predicted metal-dependent hydrolase
MAQKIVDIPGIGEVILSKRRGAKNLRLTIQPNGQVRVGLPAWAPYSTAIKFALNRTEWINLNLKQYQATALQNGDFIGKSYQLKFASGVLAVPAIKTRLGPNTITVTSHLDSSDLSVQASAAKACERALKKEAGELLGRRLAEVAEQYDFRYKDLRIKRLTSRWGSCSPDGRITLNYFLVQLPWHLIDYVIVHELTHTQHHNHSSNFWKHFEGVLPNVKQLRKEIKLYHPVLLPNGQES